MSVKRRTSTLVDCAFIALDRGLLRKDVAHLAWLYVELEDAQNSIHTATRQSHIDSACQRIKAINTELGLPTSENIVDRVKIELAQNEIFYRLTGQNEPLSVEDDAV